MAVGATAAGAYSLNTDSQTSADDTIVASGAATAHNAAATGSVDGMQIVTVASSANSSVHAEEITKAAAFAQERAEREARLSRPLFVMPTKGFVWTSTFGYRWGVPLVGSMDHVDPGRHLECFAGQVPGAPDPTAAEGQLPRVRLAVCQQFFDAIDVQRRIHDQYDRHHPDHRHRRKILQGIVWGFGI